jgi:hypothetical protein
VLANGRKHGVAMGPGVDPCSSAAWFDGFRGDTARPTGSSPVSSPRTWLAAIGWRRHGLIGVDEAPRSRRYIS